MKNDFAPVHIIYTFIAGGADASADYIYTFPEVMSFPWKGIAVFVMSFKK